MGDSTAPYPRRQKERRGFESRAPSCQGVSPTPRLRGIWAALISNTLICTSSQFGSSAASGEKREDLASARFWGTCGRCARCARTTVRRRRRSPRAAPRTRQLGVRASDEITSGPFRMRVRERLAEFRQSIVSTASLTARPAHKAIDRLITTRVIYR